MNIESIIDDAEDKNMAPPRGTDAMLYGLAGEVGRAASKNTEANPYAACMGFLVSLSAAVGREIFYQLGDDVHHPRIFTLHVGRSGRGRKGSSTGLTGKIRTKVDSLHRKSFTGNMVDLVDHPHIMGQQHTGGLSSREGLAFLIHDGYSTGKTEVPAIDDKRLMVIESEFVNVLHQGKRDGNTLSAALRDIWDGKTIKPATKTATMGATDPHIAMLGNITPSELVSSIDSRELTNGFANRFLIFWAEKMKNVPRPKPTDESLVMNLAIKTLDIVRWAKGNYPDDQNTREMTLSDDAGTLYDNFYPSLCRPIDGGLLDGILERRAAYVIRLSMLFAITDKSLVIEVRHLEAALAWVNHSVESVRYIFSSADKERRQQEIEVCAKSILEYLQQKPDGVPKSQINRELFKGKIPDNADDALNLLLTDAPPKVEMMVIPRKDGKHGRQSKFYRALRH